MAAEPPMKRTQFAQQGLDFVTLFAAKFVTEKVSGHAPRLREPIADSTGGGKQALQHMVLEPQKVGEPILTVGSVNVVTKTAKLRTYDCVRQLHRMRFGKRRFAVAQSEYQSFFERVMAFMKRQGMQVEIETRPPEVTGSIPPPREGSSLLVWLFVILVVVFVVVLAFMVVTRRVAF